MYKLLLRPYRYCIIFSILLTVLFTYALLDTFVIPKTLKAVSTELMTPSVTTQPLKTPMVPIITDTTYWDDNMKITLETVRAYKSDVYIADIELSDVSYLKAAFAKNKYGKNIKENTYAMAEVNNAILAINGDYYGFRNEGYVLRNGILYRDSARNEKDDDALVIDNNGNFSIIEEKKADIYSMDLENTWQVFTFGPALINNGEISVNENSEVARSLKSNPRTAIGQISDLHYVIIVSDGRTRKSEGLSLWELALIFKERGCQTAYNLDGGGSSTMYFNGKIINNPTDGNTTEERAVSDIVYIG